MSENCNEQLKKVSVPRATEYFNPEKFQNDANKKAKDARDWGNDDYRAIIRRNMQGYSRKEK